MTAPAVKDTIIPAQSHEHAKLKRLIKVVDPEKHVRTLLLSFTHG